VAASYKIYVVYTGNFRNTSHFLPLRLSGSEIHIAFTRNRMACL